MFILTEKNQAAAVRQALRQRLKDTGVTVAHPGGEVLVLEGETFRLDGESLRLLPGVRAVQRLTEPYPLAARTGHPEDTVVSVGKARIGQDFCLIAGPCAVESSEQVTSIARQVSALGAGEILLTSMDRDGTRSGYDLDLLRAVSGAVPVPVVAANASLPLKAALLLSD